MYATELEHSDAAIVGGRSGKHPANSQLRNNCRELAFRFALHVATFYNMRLLIGSGLGCASVNAFVTAKHYSRMTDYRSQKWVIKTWSVFAFHLHSPRCSHADMYRFAVKWTICSPSASVFHLPHSMHKHLQIIARMPIACNMHMHIRRVDVHHRDVCRCT